MTLADAEKQLVEAFERLRLRAEKAEREASDLRAAFRRVGEEMGQTVVLLNAQLMRLKIFRDSVLLWAGQHSESEMVKDLETHLEIERAWQRRGS